MTPPRLVPPGDAEALADALARWRRTRRRGRTWPGAGSSRPARYSWDACAERMGDLLRGAALLAGPPVAGTSAGDVAP